jgi:hypothetical protein
MALVSKVDVVRSISAMPKFDDAEQATAWVKKQPAPVINVHGDVLAAGIVARSEKELGRDELWPLAVEAVAAMVVSSKPWIPVSLEKPVVVEASPAKKAPRKPRTRKPAAA